MGATAVNYATCSVADYEIGDAASLLAHALLLEPGRLLLLMSLLG